MALPDPEEVESEPGSGRPQSRSMLTGQGSVARGHLLWVTVMCAVELRVAMTLGRADVYLETECQFFRRTDTQKMSIWNQTQFYLSI